jgi:hypothetical protein
MDDQIVLSMAQTLECETQRLTQEIRTIANDMEVTAAKQRRYGDVFLTPLQYLAQLRQHKELRLQEIQNQMSALQSQLDNSAQLLQILQHAGRTATIVKPSNPQLSSSINNGGLPFAVTSPQRFTSLSPGRR